jgi:hypothetical protein
MIALTDMKHGRTVIAATEFYWKEFEEQRDQFCAQLLDNIDSRHIDMQAATLEDVRYQVEKVNDSDVEASDIGLIFGHDGSRYSILLDD